MGISRKKFEINFVDAINGELIDSNFVHNRFDLFCKNNCKVIRGKDLSGVYHYLCYHYKEDYAELSLWCNPIPYALLQNMIRFIFKNEKQVKRLNYKNSYYDLGVGDRFNHYRIILPHTEDELQNRLSSKGRYNIGREKRVLERDFGKIMVNEYSVYNAPQKVIEKYFSMKYKTHQFLIDSDPLLFIKNARVSNIYSLDIAEQTVAIILSCEDCPIVYLENLTYDIQYAKYSPGKILYDYYLRILVRKGKKEVYLLGGDYEYKKRYGSIHEAVYRGVIHRNPLLNFKYTWKKKLKEKTKNMLERCHLYKFCKRSKQLVSFQFWS